MFICCGNDFLVTNTAPWLDNDMNPSGCQHIEPITEREKSITCRYPTNGSGPCAFARQPRCVETVLLAPANTPSEVIKRLNAEVTQIMSTQEVKDKLVSIGAEPQASTTAEFSNTIATEIPKWRSLIEKLGPL